MAHTLASYPGLNPQFSVTELAATATQATIVIEPLEQGFGHTIGNALRRVLLSSLPGTAVTAVRIAGVDHQFSTLEGMTEDMVEFVLNAKLVRVKAESDEPATLTVSKKGAGSVTAGDIVCPAGYSIVNPDLVLATLDKNGDLSAEFTVESGVGYVMAQDKEATSLIGEILVDALFSPVITVSYEVEATRVGRRTDFDKVVLKVTTDGTVTPLASVHAAAEILTAQFSHVVNPGEMVAQKATLPPIPTEEDESFSLTVEELELPTRIANALRRGGFRTVGDLNGASRGVIARVKNLGEKSVVVIEEALVKKGGYFTD